MSNPGFSRSVYSNFQDAKQKGKIGTLKPYEEFVSEFQVTVPATPTPTTPPTTQATPSAQVGDATFPTPIELNQPVGNQPLPNVGVPQAHQTTPTGLPVMQQAQTTATGSGGVPAMPDSGVAMPQAESTPFLPQDAYDKPFEYTGKLIGTVLRDIPKYTFGEPLKGVAQASRWLWGSLGIPQPDKVEDDWLYKAGQAINDAGEYVMTQGGNQDLPMNHKKGAFAFNEEEASSALAPQVPTAMAQVISLIGTGGGSSTARVPQLTEMAVQNLAGGLKYITPAKYAIMEWASKIADKPGVIASLQGLSQLGGDAANSWDEANQMSRDEYVNSKILNQGAKRSDAEETYDLLKSKTRDEVIQSTFPLALMLAQTEKIPLEAMFKWVPEQTFSRIGNIVATSGVGLATEAITEGAQTGIENIGINMLYDKTRETFAGMEDASKVGGTSGFVFGVFIGALKKRKQRIKQKVDAGEMTQAEAIKETEEINKTEEFVNDKVDAFEASVAMNIPANKATMESPEAQTFFDSNEASLTNPIATMPAEVETTFDKITNGILISDKGLHDAYQWVTGSVKATLENQTLSPAEKGATLNILNGMLSDIDKANTEGQKFVEEVETASVQDRVPAVREGVATLPQGQNPSETTTPVPTPSITKAREVKQKTNVLPSSGEVIVTPAPATEEAVATETEVMPEDSDVMIERANNATVPEGNGTWRKAFNDSKDFSQKTQILEVFADSQTSTENELRDVYEVAKIVEPNTNRVNVALARNPNTPQDVFDDLIQSKELEKTLMDAGINELIQRRKELQPTATEVPTTSPTPTTETVATTTETVGQEGGQVEVMAEETTLTSDKQVSTQEAGKPQATTEGEVKPTPEAKPKTPLNEARNARRQAQAKAKQPTQDQRVKAREAYFKPGAIVESYAGGRDKVIEYTQDPNDPTKWSVTVQGVDAKGNPVGEPRTHKTEPTDKEYKRAGVEVKAEKTITPPTPTEVKENSEKVYNDTQSTFVFPFGLNPKFKFDVRLPENVQRFFKKYFRPRGLWTPELFKGKRSNEGRIASQAERAKFKIRDLQDAISESYPNGVKESDVKRMNEFLQGNPIELPPALYKPLEAMREDIDRLSRIMIEEGIVDQKLVPVFNANMGMYTTRTYDIHNDPESWISYIKNTPEGEQLRNKAVNWLRQEYEAKADRADKLADKSEARAVSFSNQAQKTQDPDKILELEYYADRAIQRADKLRAQAEALRQGDFNAKIDAFLFDESQPLDVVKKGKYGSKDLGILQKRKNIPEVIRELMGEAQDPITNYTMSVAKMASLISNNKFLNDAKVQGLKDGTFTKEESGKNIVRIAAESTDAMRPLNNLWVTEEIAQAFEEYQKVVESPDYIKLMLRLNGMIKLGKTVLSPTTHVRNFGSNIIIEVGNGSFSLNGLKEAGASQYEQIFGLKTGDRKEKVREYVEKLIKLGVLGSGANYGDMLAYYDDIRSGGKYDYQKVIEPKLKSGLKSGMDAIKNLYRAEDDFFKVHAFEDERATLKKAYGNTKTDEQLDELAADKVLRTRINYDMAPKIVDAIRRVPFMGTFPTFPAEVVRISANIPMVAVEEMRSGNKVLQKRGSQRMAGYMVALALPSALNELTRYLLDIDDEEEEARKLFIAPWSQNSTLVWLDKDRYVDTGYSDAFNTIKTPVVAALKGGDLVAGGVAAIMDFVDPYISGEIGFKMVKEISDNRDEYDNPVYNENADVGTQLSQIFGFAMKKAEPGFVSQARRFYKGETGELAEKGQEYSTKDELINLTLGQKVVTVDWDNAVLFKLKANAEDIKDSNSFYNKANKQLPEKDKKGRVQEAEATNLAVERSVEQLREYYNATKAMGFSTAKAIRLMKEANIPKDIILAVATNQPYKNFLIVTKKGAVIDRNTQRLISQ